jgi:CelD/BcsL family acetyltransferase involved in cellulose biosynthesis
MSEWAPYEASLSPADAKLKFTIGYWHLHTHRLPALKVTAYFAELPPHPLSARDIEALPGTARQPLLITSHPIDRDVPALEFGPKVIRYCARCYARSYVSLRGAFEPYLESIRRKRRSELRRKMRRFAQSGPNFFREYRSAEEMRSFFEFAVAVSRRSFQKRLGYGLPETAEYFSDVTRSAGENRIRGYILFYSGQPVAFALCHANGSALTGELCGYDSAFSHLSPGIVLIGYLLEHLFAEQSFETLDLGTGEADYKVFFATGSTPCADVYYFPRSLRSTILVITHYLTAVMWRWIAKILALMRLRDRLKKLFRQGLDRRFTQPGSHAIRQNAANRHSDVEADITGSASRADELV